MSQYARSSAVVALAIALAAAPLAAQSPAIAPSDAWSSSVGFGFLSFNSAIPRDGRAGVTFDGWTARRVTSWGSARIGVLAGGFPVLNQGDQITIPCTEDNLCGRFNGPDYIAGLNGDLVLGGPHGGTPYLGVGGGGYATEVLEESVVVGSWHVAVGCRSPAPERWRVEARYVELIRGGQRAGWVVPVTVGLAF